MASQELIFKKCPLFQLTRRALKARASSSSAPLACSRHKIPETSEKTTPLEFDREQRKQADDAATMEFFRLWWTSICHIATVSELFDFAIQARLPLFGETKQGRMVALGRWLGERQREIFQSDEMIYQFETVGKNVNGRSSYRLAGLRLSDTLGQSSSIHNQAESF